MRGCRIWAKSRPNWFQIKFLKKWLSEAKGTEILSEKVHDLSRLGPNLTSMWTWVKFILCAKRKESIDVHKKNPNERK